MASDDNSDLQEMEERLYAQIHFDHCGNDRELERISLGTRFGTHERVTAPNNANRGRYWASNDEKRGGNQGNFEKRQQNRTRNQFQVKKVQRQDERVSNLSQNQRSNRYNFSGNGGKQFEKRSQMNNFPKKKGPIKGVNPFNVANQEKVRLENKIRVMQKKKKALMRQGFKVPELPSTSRDRNMSQKRASNVCTSTIFVDSCSDGESVELTEDKIKVEKNISDDNDSTRDDDVILIPTPAPEVVSLLDSDDDSQDVVVQETSKSANKGTAAQPSGSRCVSPSNSSILSDDFIGTNDRTRLQSEFLFVLPEDEDLRGADKNQSSSSEDSSHSNASTPDKNPPKLVPGPSSVGNLGEFIVRGEAVESSFNDYPHKKQKTSHIVFDLYQSLASDYDSEEDEVMETEDPPTEPPIDVDKENDENTEKNDDEVQIVTETTEKQPINTNRERNTSEISSECDIVLNISSKSKDSVTNDEGKSNEEPVIQKVQEELETIQLDDETEDDGTPKRLDPEIGWNDEMKRYYHESWGGEQFQLRRILGAMTRE